MIVESVDAKNRQEANRKDLENQTKDLKKEKEEEIKAIETLREQNEEDKRTELNLAE